MNTSVMYACSMISMIIIFSVPITSDGQVKDRSSYNTKTVMTKLGGVFIKGRIVDKETGEALKVASVITNDGMVVKADTNGYFCQHIKPGAYTVKAFAFPYYSVTTKPINTLRPLNWTTLLNNEVVS